MKKFTNFTAYTVEDFINGKVVIDLLWGYRLNVDEEMAEDMSTTYAVWVSDKDGNTIDETSGITSEEQCLDTIRMYGLKYSVRTA